MGRKNKEKRHVMDETLEVPLETVYWIDATDITEEQIKNMAASIVVHGQIEEIVVNERDEKGYRGVIGRLRYEGMKRRWGTQATGKTIRARIHKFRDEIEIKMSQLVENLHRREVPAMQKARQYRDLYTLLRKEHGEAATINTLVTAIESCTGNKESMKTVQHYLSLTKLEPETQKILTREKMSLRHGLELLRVKDPKTQVEVAEKAKDQKLSIQEVKWKVDEVLTEERQAKHKKRLEKKAKEIRARGITVYLDTPYESWEQHQKDSKKYRRFWGEIPEKCQSCPKKGVLLGGNFQQKPICTDPECYEKTQLKKRQAEQRKLKELEKKLDEDRAKVYDMKPDARVWRLTVMGLFDNWDLSRILEVERKGVRGDTEEAVWKALCKLDMEECQKLLIREAVKKVLIGPQKWRGDSIVKRWAVKEFKLTPEVFLSPEEEGA